MNPVNQGFPEMQVGHFSEICRTLTLNVFAMCRRLRSDFCYYLWYTSAKFVVHFRYLITTPLRNLYHTSDVLKIIAHT